MRRYDWLLTLCVVGVATRLGMCDLGRIGTFFVVATAQHRTLAKTMPPYPNPTKPRGSTQPRATLAAFTWTLLIRLDLQSE